MDVQLTADESDVVQQALRTYCSDLRMEIVDTDNPSYRRDLKSERSLLETVLAKLDGAAAENAQAARQDQPEQPEQPGQQDHVVVRMIGIWQRGGPR